MYDGFHDDANKSLILNSLMYIIPGKSVDGMSVVEIINNYGTQDLKALLKDSSFTSYYNSVRVSNSSWGMSGYNSGTVGAVFTDGSGQITVAFRGTADGEWPDNSAAYGKVNPPSSTSPQQEEALRWFEDVASNYEGRGFSASDDISITGHSKGGNKAQYITMFSIYGTLIDRCLNYDGQGFSDEAVADMIARYGEEYYEMQKRKIFGIYGENDYVHMQGNQQLVPEDQRFYVSTPGREGLEGFPDYHDIFCMIVDGKLVYVADPGPLGELAYNLVEDINKLPKEQQEAAARVIMSLLEGIEGSPDGLHGESVSFLDWWETIVHTGPIAIGNLLSTEEGHAVLAEFLGPMIEDFRQKYGAAGLFGLGVVFSLIAVVATPIVALAMLIDAICHFIADVVEKIKDIGKAISDFFVGVWNKIIEFGQKFADWWNNNLNVGFMYSRDNPAIRVDTTKLRNYANELRSINSKLASIDRRMDRIYWHLINLDDLIGSAVNLWRIFKADILTGYNLRMSGCISYLETTSDAFETAEQEVRSNVIKN
jgi:hypothetical protein